MKRQNLPTEEDIFREHLDSEVSNSYELYRVIKPLLHLPNYEDYGNPRYESAINALAFANLCETCMYEVFECNRHEDFPLLVEQLHFNELIEMWEVELNGVTVEERVRKDMLIALKEICLKLKTVFNNDLTKVALLFSSIFNEDFVVEENSMSNFISYYFK